MVFSRKVQRKKPWTAEDWALAHVKARLVSDHIDVHDLDDEISRSLVRAETGDKRAAWPQEESS